MPQFRILAFMLSTLATMIQLSASQFYKCSGKQCQTHSGSAEVLSCSNNRPTELEPKECLYADFRPQEENKKLIYCPCADGEACYPGERESPSGFRIAKCASKSSPIAQKEYSFEEEGFFAGQKEDHVAPGECHDKVCEESRGGKSFCTKTRPKEITAADECFYADVKGGDITHNQSTVIYCPCKDGKECYPVENKSGPATGKCLDKSSAAAKGKHSLEEGGFVAARKVT